MRSAPEKLRNRTSAAANVTQSSPGTRVNRYISRLIEARQTQSDTAGLHYLTLSYRDSEREHRVRVTVVNRTGLTPVYDPVLVSVGTVSKTL